jgi:3-phosphoshikimate 1-carboxyvinyltransferase
MRLLSGILAGQDFASAIGGDESLSGRPMDRILTPLTQMGAKASARDDRFPPLEFQPADLKAIDYTPPMASAQVKSCVLLAGLRAEGETIVREAIRTRDHTEVLLREMGVAIDSRRGLIRLSPPQSLNPQKTVIPSDLSSAAFFLGAALLVPESKVMIQGVGLNPTRTALLDFLHAMGARIQMSNVTRSGGEMVGDLLAEHARLKGGVIEGELTAALIDEIPMLAVLGAASRDGLVVRDAAELRVKETDRIDTIVKNLRLLGAEVDEHPDGFEVKPIQRFTSATFPSYGDHRIAMAFSIAALRADGESMIENAEAAAVSFPEFYETLREISQ